MKRILILKTGDTYPEIAVKKGDFEDMIISGMGIDRSEFLIINVPKIRAFPDNTTIAGIVITGSHDMITDDPAWSLQTETFVKAAVSWNMPVLGICYGHQMLAQAIGGHVKDNPRGLEFGTVRINLSPAASEDLLFTGFPTEFHVQATHTQSVIYLPPEATVLASNNHEKIHAFSIGKKAWGLQFHPEFDAETVKEYIRKSRKTLAQQGQDPDILIAGCRETSISSKILSRFGDIIKGS